MNPPLVTNGGHGRMVGIYRRHALSAAGVYTLRDSRTGVFPVVPVEGTPNVNRYVLNSNAVMGEMCEMRMVALSTNRRYMRVGRGPLLPVAGGTERWGRFARLGDSVFMTYIVPGAAIPAVDDSHLMEYKIVRIVEVLAPDMFAWGPGVGANHHAYNGRQQDLYLDN